MHERQLHFLSLDDRVAWVGADLAEIVDLWDEEITIMGDDSFVWEREVEGLT